MAAVFVVALGYGAHLPALPMLLGKWLGQSNAGSVPSYTGMVLGTYMLAIFTFALLWGALADGVGSRAVILTGLASYVLSIVLFDAYSGLRAAYGTRLVSGAFASAVLCGATTLVSTIAAPETRMRSLILINAALLTGLLLGPAIAGLMTYSTEDLRLLARFSLDNAAGVPVLMSVLVAIPAWIAGWFLLTRLKGVPQRGPVGRPQLPDGRRLYGLLLVGFVTLGFGAFEVGVILLAQQNLDLPLARISVLFIACGVAVVLVHALFFLRASLRSILGTPVAAGSVLLAMATALSFVPLIPTFETLVATGAVIAAATSILLTAWSLPLLHTDGRASALFMQMSVASLGLGIGSMIGGALFGSLGTSSFWVTAAIMATAAILATVVLRCKQPTSLPTKGTWGA